MTTNEQESFIPLEDYLVALWQGQAVLAEIVPKALTITQGAIGQVCDVLKKMSALIDSQNARIARLEQAMKAQQTASDPMGVVQELSQRGARVYSGEVGGRQMKFVTYDLDKAPA